MKATVSRLFFYLFALVAALAFAPTYAACTAGQPIADVEEATPSADFLILPGGLVANPKTGLVWKRCAEGQSWDGTSCAGEAGLFTWSGALTRSVAASDGGSTQWRIPNRKELESIVEFCGHSPAINQGLFPNTSADRFWSSTTFVVEPNRAWDVYFSDGYVGATNKNAQQRVRLVRDLTDGDVPLAQSIAFEVPAEKRLGDPAFTISATASSGLPVGFASLTPEVCAVSGELVSLSAVGTCTLRATQEGDASFASAYLDRDIAVLPPPAVAVSVTLSGLVHTYDGTRKDATCATSPEVEHSLAYTDLGSGMTRVDAGSHGVSCTVTEAGYVGEAAGVMIIARAGQSINPGLGSASLTYNGPAAVFAPTASSGLPVAIANLTPDVCAVVGGALAPKKAGICTLVANQSGNQNYLPAPQMIQSITVARAEQTIAWNPPATLATGGDLSLDAVASSGLQVSYASQTPTICAVEGDKLSTLAEGGCQVEASQAGDADYQPAPPVLKDIQVGPPQYTLSLVFAGQGTGRATGVLEGEACTESCSRTYPAGSVVEVVADATGNSRFGGWSGACSGRKDGCRVVLDQDRSLTATFNPRKGYIQVRSPNAGETWVLGETYSIDWLAEGKDRLSIDLYRGGAWVANLAIGVRQSNRSDSDDRGRDWTIPDLLEPAGDYRLRIASEKDPSLFDESDYPFSLVRPVVGVDERTQERFSQAWLALTGLAIDPSTLQAWADRPGSKGGNGVDKSADPMQEFVATVAPDVVGLGDDELIARLHQNLFNRDASRKEAEEALDRLTDRRVTTYDDRANAIAGLLEDMTSKAKGDDAQVLSNKTAATAYATSARQEACRAEIVPDWLVSHLADVGSGKDTLVSFKSLFDEEFGCH